MRFRLRTLLYVMFLAALPAAAYGMGLRLRLKVYEERAWPTTTPQS